MRLTEALKLSQQDAASPLPSRKIYLACGFTPLHLRTFIAAHARLRFDGDDRRIEVETGHFDDIEGTLERASASGAEGAAVVLEWSDFDARLGWRAAAGWRASVLADVPGQVERKLERLAALIEKLAARMPVAYAGPSLALPPLTPYPERQSGPWELHLRAQCAALAARLGAIEGVRVVSESALAAASPPEARHDAAMDLTAGYPYANPHAAALAAALIACLFPAAPKKGLITDLDNTLWKGIVGEAGVDGVAWDLSGHARQHGLYQQLLASLAESGTLLAVASKNEAAPVEQALARPDLLLDAARVFPVEAHWGAKSESVRRILAAWNVGADSVVFVDDSPMELAEVAEHHPAVECIQFPAGPGAAPALLRRLRTLFAKPKASEEDRLRLDSLRGRAAFEQERSNAAAAGPGFLERLGAAITFELSHSPGDARAFELINKTNQFNLNGRRLTEQDWRAHFERPGAFLLTASYEDRFGPLGKIAALTAHEAGGATQVEAWVMSCRAFSRQIEFHMLDRVLRQGQGRPVAFDFEKTGRNGPLQELFGLLFPAGADGGRLTPGRLAEVCPELPHRIFEKDQV